MKVHKETQLDFCDVLLAPRASKINSRADASVIRVIEKFKYATHGYKGTPIIAANMDTVGTFSMASALQKHDVMTALHKHYPIDDNFAMHWNSLTHSFYTMGVSVQDEVKYKEFFNRLGYAPSRVCIDVANGYMEKFTDFVKRFRDEHPDTLIMAGNVVTGEGTYALIQAGADIVKVGIGSGSVCLTRRVAGVGRPQLSAIIDCASTARELGGYICSDGGCVEPGDVAKAFGAGADFVMLGGMLAGHDECEGEIKPSGKDEDSSKYMEFYGMSSGAALDKYHGGIANHRTSEGRVIRVPYRGSVDGTIEHIISGVRSGMSYVGAPTLNEMSSQSEFYLVNRQLNQVFGA